MTDLQRQDLQNYFLPIYYIEFELQRPGELFPFIFRNAYYGRWAKKEALEIFNQDKGLRVIEKSMRTGKEKIIAER